MNLEDVGYMSASKFSRLSSADIRALKPITILLHQGKPIRVVIQYEAYLKMQSELI